MARYEEGTIVQRRNTVRYVKTAKGLLPEHRMVAEYKILKRELLPNERVFHRDYDDFQNNEPDNLYVIKYRTNPFRPLPKSRIIFIPSARTARMAA